MTTLKVDKETSEFLLFSSYSEKEKCKKIEGAYWDFNLRCWRYPAEFTTYAKIKQLFFQDLEEEGDILSILDRSQEQKEEMKKFQTLDLVDESALISLPSKTKPMKHQKVATTLALDKVGFGLFMEQGTGKTKCAVDLIGHYFTEKKMASCLIIAPLVVLGTWRNELKIHGDFQYTVTILQGDMKTKKKQLASALKKKNTIVITNYESLYRMDEALEQANFDIVIADEAHRAKNVKTKTNTALCRVSLLSKVRLALTGTPMGNSPLDVFGIYKFMNTRIFGSSYYGFRGRYAKMGGYQNKVVVKLINQEELSEKMYTIAYRVTKNEALELPAEMSVTVPVTLEEKTMELYKKLESDTWFGVGEDDGVSASVAISFLTRASQITGGYVTTVNKEIFQVSKAKISALEDLCLDLLEDPQRKVVIFARFTAEIDAISELLKKKKVGHFIIDGRVSSVEKRQKMIDTFQSPSLKERVFILQPRAGGVGVTLTKADSIIFYSLDYSYIDYEQAKARVYRNGQENKVTYHHLIAADTVDEDILSALLSKQDVSKKVVDRYKSEYKKLG